jgi:hypothetical protein
MTNFDPAQREHEVAEALLTLLIAVSRYGTRKPRKTKARTASLERIVALVVAGVEERVRNIRGNKTATDFRTRLGRGRS